MSLQTVEAVVDEYGQIHLLEPVVVSTRRRALVTILDELPAETAEPTGQDEASLDWMRLATTGGAFDFWNDPAEDIYTSENGEPR